MTGDHLPPQPAPPVGSNGSPPSRYEWNDHKKWLDGVIGKIERQGERRDHHIDEIERRLDRYLGVAIAMPWLLVIITNVGWYLGWWGG